MITPQRNPQNDDGAPASKTQLMECPTLLLIGWIEPSSMVWCALAGNFPNSTTLLSSEAPEGDMLRLEWCGGIFHPRDQAVEQGEWIFHH